MEKVSVHLRHCYGIEELQTVFDFSDGNAIAIYARNGLMKTSLAKTFQKIQEGKKNVVKDEIFEVPGQADVKIDDVEASPGQIFVIKSFESDYEADITSLLVDDQIKIQLREVTKAQNRLYKALESASGLKIKKTSAGKAVYELEDTILQDFGFDESSFLLNLEKIRMLQPSIFCGEVTYNSIFDDTALKKISSPEFQGKIGEYLTKSEEVYSSFAFLEKGQFTLPKLKDLKKTLEKDKFFVRRNKIVLGGDTDIPDIHALNGQIEAVDNQLRDTPEFQAIEKLLSDSKGVILKDVIETHPEIISYLKLEQLPELRRSLWLSYIQDNEALFDDLYSKYNVLEQSINAIEFDDTPWRHALDVYNKRFSVPYEMEISNLKGAVIGESIPRVEFKFSNNDSVKRMSRARLDAMNVLSRGEQRALYLLNVIFNIEKIKANRSPTLFVIDDIADSFDYKNKYAIIEYLYELAENNDFCLLILSHNFDFYRSISCRLGLKRTHRLCAERVGHTVVLRQELYQKQPFEYWKKHPSKRTILAMIPFVRNIVEYGCDRDVEETGSDYDLLTCLLHEKNLTQTLKFKQLVNIYKEYLAVDIAAVDGINLDDNVVDALYDVCDSITDNDSALDHKVILSMAIRHKAETFMFSQIESYDGNLNWKNGRTTETGSPSDFLIHVDGKGNQTRELLNGYKQFGVADKIKLLEEVNIMTPENIHLNSFMYEPILDMDIFELMGLYGRIKQI